MALNWMRAYPGRIGSRRRPASGDLPHPEVIEHVGPAVVPVVAIEPLELRADRRFGSRELSRDGRHPNQRQHRVNRHTTDRCHRSVYREAAVARYPILRGELLTPGASPGRQEARSAPPGHPPPVPAPATARL